MNKQVPSWSFQPLGGYGEIGSNMNLIQLENTQLIIDIGILFPSDQCFDINYLIPSFESIDPDKFTVIWITHGHEDHIGAIYHLVSYLKNYQIYAPGFAKVLINNKLEFRNMTANIKEYSEGDEFNFEFLKIVPFQVNHSIPDTYGVVIQDTLNDFCINYISDFKYDPKAVHEPVANLDRLKKLNSSFKNRIAMLDSTNILQKGKTLSEQELIPDLERIITESFNENQNTFITLFSSNIHRVKNIIQISLKHEIPLYLWGRSLHNYTAAAFEANQLTRPEILACLDGHSLEEDKKGIHLLTGCQGDFKGALNRLAQNQLAAIKVTENDRVVFSSKSIPGNEKQVYKIINKFAEMKAIVFTDRDACIHASGHANQDDLKAVIDSIEPTQYIPIHGESFFLYRHQIFIDSLNMNIKTSILLNGNVLKIHNSKTSIEETIIDKPRLIHGNAIEINREAVNERRKIACAGVIFVSQGKNRIQMTSKGLPTDKADLLQKLDSIIATKFNYDSQKEEVRIYIRNFYNKNLGYKPIVIVH